MKPFISPTIVLSVTCDTTKAKFSTEVDHAGG